MKKVRNHWLDAARMKDFALGTLGFFLFAFAALIAALNSDSSSGTRRTDLPAATLNRGAASVNQPAVPWYIRSGQWRADIRTLAAALQYLADGVERPPTNGLPIKAILERPGLPAFPRVFPLAQLEELQLEPRQSG